MKKVIMIAFALTLALSIVLVPSVAADEPPYPITIIKTIPAGGPEEDFTFHAWRDYNNNFWLNGVVDDDDVYLGSVVIHGAGTGTIDSPVLGSCIVCEELIPGSAYEPQPCQLAQPGCVPITFENEIGVLEVGQLEILKEDENGNLIDVPGATFVITPDPKTGVAGSSRTVVDNGLNDEDPDVGVLGVTDCIVCVECTVTETVAPPGYILDPTPQPAHVTTAGETVTLEFENTKLLPDICIEKLVDCNDDGEYLQRDTGYYGDTPSWYIRVWNCGETPLLNVMVSDTNGMSWGPFDLDIGEEWEVTYEGDPIYETTTNTAEAIAEDGSGAMVGPVSDWATNVVTPPSCGTVCAAQTAPGEFLFDAAQENWFTWIYYDIGWGTEDDPYEYPIYTGATTLCGTLLVYDDGTHIFVNYVLTDTDSCTLGGLSEYHLQVDESLTDLKKHVMNKKNPVPGKCEYKGAFDPMVPATGWIEADNKSDDDISGWDTAYIFAHGVGCYYCP